MEVDMNFQREMIEAIKHILQEGFQDGGYFEVKVYRPILDPKAEFDRGREEGFKAGQDYERRRQYTTLEEN